MQRRGPPPLPFCFFFTKKMGKFFIMNINRGELKVLLFYKMCVYVCINFACINHMKYALALREDVYIL
jgi:hypothetical protein